MKKLNKNINVVLCQFFFFIAFLFSSQIAIGQGQITGHISQDATGEPILFATIALLQQSGIVLFGTDTDLDGNYILENIPSGTYEIEISYLGFGTNRIEEIEIKDNEQTIVNSKMIVEGSCCCCYYMWPEYNPPLIDLNDTTSGQTIVFQNRRK